MVRVKICGITEAEDAAFCVEEGADALGFVVEYPREVPWNLTRHQAAELMAAVAPFVARVAVVGGDAKGILELAEATEPNAVQLHANESEEVVAELARHFAGTGIRIVKALRVDAAAPEPADHWAEQARRFVEAGADALLVDSVTPARPAGTGQAVDWSLVRAVIECHAAPVILAGGLTPENVGPTVEAVQPYAVDVISSVEGSGHRKDRARVRAFISAAKGF
jgi:phosphoribosylanthranilate isomerase